MSLATHILRTSGAPLSWGDQGNQGQYKRPHSIPSNADTSPHRSSLPSRPSSCLSLIPTRSCQGLILNLPGLPASSLSLQTQDTSLSHPLVTPRSTQPDSFWCPGEYRQSVNSHPTHAPHFPSTPLCSLSVTHRPHPPAQGLHSQAP